jgi:hypothetical protein
MRKLLLALDVKEVDLLLLDLLPLALQEVHHLSLIDVIR